MGWKDSAKSGGGGFLNGVEAVILGYQFTNEFPSENAKTDDTKKLYMVLTVQEAGAEESQDTTLNGGGGEFFEISADGHVLTSVDSGRAPKLWEASAIYKFVSSIVDAEPRFDDRLPDPNVSLTIDLRPIIGTRVRLEQVVVTDAKTGKALTRKVKAGKHAGKEFKVTNLQVVKVLELPAEGKKPATAAKKAATGASKPLAAAPAPSADLADTVDEFITNLLAAAEGNSLERTALSISVTRRGAKLKMAATEYDPIRKLLISEAYLADAAERGIVALDGSTVSLPF